MKKLKFSPAIFFSVFVIALVILRAILVWVEPAVYNNIWVKNRIRQSLEALSDPALKEKNLYLFLGPSEIEVGFNPVIFDRNSKELGIDSYTLNLGVRNVGTILDVYLSRIKYELITNNLRPKVIFLQVPPSRLTKKALFSFRESQRSHDLSAVYFNSALLFESNISPENRFFVAFNKYVLGERSLGILTNPLNGYLRGVMRPRDKTSRAISKLWSSNDFLTKPEWNFSDQGHFYWDFSRISGGFDTKSYITIMRSKVGLNETMNRFVGCCDYLELDIDINEVKRVAQVIKDLKEYTDHVVIVQIPENPYVKRSPESYSRWASVAETLGKEADVRVIYPEDSASFNRPDYVDIVHFSRLGIKKFARVMSELNPMILDQN